MYRIRLQTISVSPAGQDKTVRGKIEKKGQPENERPEDRIFEHQADGDKDKTAGKAEQKGCPYGTLLGIHFIDLLSSPLFV